MRKIFLFLFISVADTHTHLVMLVLGLSLTTLALNGSVSFGALTQRRQPFVLASTYRKGGGGG
jgi:hypothetical protein